MKKVSKTKEESYQFLRKGEGKEDNFSKRLNEAEDSKSIAEIDEYTALKLINGPGGLKVILRSLSDLFEKGERQISEFNSPGFRQRITEAIIVELNRVKHSSKRFSVSNIMSQINKRYKGSA